MIKVNQRIMFSLSEIREEQAAFRSGSGGETEKKTIYFDSMQAMLKGAFHFVSLFSAWHNQGLVYGSSDESRFYFDLATGDLHCNGEDLLVKEGDPVQAEGLSAHEFLAPELVELFDRKEGETGTGAHEESWTLETDWYFMAVYLFEYFYHTGSPFEGKEMVNHCFLSPIEEELHRAREGVFCMEPGDHGNEPVRGIQDRLIRYWDEYPDKLQKVFQRAFLSGGNLINLRPTELDWKQIIVEMMMDYKTCSCGFRGFSARLIGKENGILLCPGCGKVYYPLSDGLNRILLTEGGQLYECQTGLDPLDYETVTGQIVENRRKKGLFGIKNLSDGFWRGFYPDGSTREIHHGQAIPIWEGMTLAFERGENWTLRVSGTGAEEGLIREMEAEDEAEVNPPLPVESTMFDKKEDCIDDNAE